MCGSVTPRGSVNTEPSPLGPWWGAGHGDHGWKYVPYPVLAFGDKHITHVACGSYHTAAVSDAGELYTWGGGMFGKLGHGDESGHSTPCLVQALLGRVVKQVSESVRVCACMHLCVSVRECVYVCVLRHSTPPACPTAHPCAGSALPRESCL